MKNNPTLQSLIANINAMQAAGFSEDELRPLKKRALELAKGQAPQAKPASKPAPKSQPKAGPRTCATPGCGNKIRGRLPKDPAMAKLCSVCRKAAPAAAKVPSEAEVQAASKPGSVGAATKSAKVEPEARTISADIKCAFEANEHGVRLTTDRNGRPLSYGRFKNLRTKLEASGVGFTYKNRSEAPGQTGIYVDEDANMAAAKAAVEAAFEPFTFTGKRKEQITINDNVVWQ